MNVLPFTGYVAMTSTFALLDPLLDSPFVSGSAMHGSHEVLRFVNSSFMLCSANAFIQVFI